MAAPPTGSGLDSTGVDCSGGVGSHGVLILNPTEIFFTQDSIAAEFPSAHLHEALLAAIRAGRASLTDFPTNEVAKHEERHDSLNNRRLWMFQQV